VTRTELFVTTKVWHDQLAPDALHRAFATSLRKLGLDHIDLYLIHWPSKDMDMVSTLEALTPLRERGLARPIGVGNFNLPILRRAVEEIGAPIASVQVEYHPFLAQSVLLGYLRGHGLPLTAYAPLAQGRAASDPVLTSIGQKRGVALPRSRSPGCWISRASPSSPRPGSLKAKRPILLRSTSGSTMRIARPSPPFRKTSASCGRPLRRTGKLSSEICRRIGFGGRFRWK
jgi:hypothetical protein